MKKNIYYGESDLNEIIFNLWKNKFKILIITTTFLILGLIYNYSSVKSFTANTNIKPISTFENQNYKMYNNFASIALSKDALLRDALIRDALGEDSSVEDILVKNNFVEKIEFPEILVNINSNQLLDLFISKIQTEEIIEKGIIKFKLVDKDNFNNEKSYKEAVKRKAILIIDQMTPPIKDKKNENKNMSYWKYNFKVIDKQNWSNFLEYIEKQANEEIRQSLIIQFDTGMNILKNNIKFQLEDINQKIANALDDYKISISNRLAFLEEQAQIARELNIKTNQLEAEIQIENNKIVTNNKSKNSYYLKGYQMIEKEISLINARKDEKAFVDDLFKLEQEKRSILQNQKIERIKLIFSETPVADESKFIAAKIDYVATTYKLEKSPRKILAGSIVIGLLISFMYLFLNNTIASRK